MGDDTNIKVELGFFVDTLFKGIGFILYDGGNTGESTYYKRTGLEHRWDWGPDFSTFYSFVIKTDGTGLYYDFTNADNGEAIKPIAIYKCHKR